MNRLENRSYPLVQIYSDQNIIFESYHPSVIEFFEYDLDYVKDKIYPIADTTQNLIKILTDLQTDLDMEHSSLQEDDVDYIHIGEEIAKIDVIMHQGLILGILDNLAFNYVCLSHS